RNDGERPVSDVRLRGLHGVAEQLAELALDQIDVTFSVDRDVVARLDVAAASVGRVQGHRDGDVPVPDSKDPTSVRRSPGEAGECDLLAGDDAGGRGVPAQLVQAGHGALDQVVPWKALQLELILGNERIERRSRRDVR